MKSLSPLVVSKPRIPCRGEPPGTLISQIVMQMRKQRMIIKNAAVGFVQAIQLKLMVYPLYTAQGKALSDMVTNEPDNQCPWYNCQDTGGGQNAPVKP